MCCAGVTAGMQGVSISSSTAPGAGADRDEWEEVEAVDENDPLWKVCVCVSGLVVMFQSTGSGLGKLYILRLFNR